MTFLAPTIGLVAAALATPLLILLYCLKLRRKQLRVSSTLLWRQAVQDLQVNEPFRRLRASVLLALQLLALWCVCAALSRPVIDARAAPDELTIIVLDASASMSATDGRPDREGAPRTRLEEAKSLARDLADRVVRSAGRQAMVVGAAGDAHVRCGFTNDPAVLRDAIAAVHPTDQPLDVAGVLTLLRAYASPSPVMEEDSTGDLAPAIVLFTDGALRPDDQRRLARVGGSLRTMRVGPPAADGDAARFDNLGLASLSAKRDFEDPALVRVFAAVVNARPRETRTNVLLRDDSGVIAVAPLATPGAVQGPEGWSPGRASVTLELTRTARAVLTVELDRSDVLSSDNRASLVLPEHRRARVLVVAPGETGSPAADPFLIGGLEAMELESLRVLDVETYERLDSDRIESGGASRLTADLIIFDRVTPRRAPRTATLSIGAPLAGRGIVAMGTPPEEQAARRILTWRRSHPVLRYAGLDGVAVVPTLRVQEPESDRVVVLAHTAEGPLIVVSEEENVRRMLIGFEIGRSNWGPQVSFPLVLAAAVEFLPGAARRDGGAGADPGGRGSGGDGRFVRTTDPVLIEAATGAAEVQVVDAAGEPVVSGQVAAQGGLTSIGAIARSGVFRVLGASPLDEVLAVNLLDESESGLAPSPPAVEAASRDAARGNARTSGREIWSWFVLASAILSLVEWFLYAARMRS